MLIAIIPRALPWARSFCPFRACGVKLEKVQLEQLKRYKKIREVRLVRGSLLIVLISNNNAFVS